MVVVVVLLLMMMTLLLQNKCLCEAQGRYTAVIYGFFTHISAGYIWRIRSGICHFFVYTPVFFCQDKNGGTGIAMWRQTLGKINSFGTGDALGR